MDMAHLPTLAYTLAGILLGGTIAGLWIHHCWGRALFLWLIFWTRVPVFGTNAGVAAAAGAGNPETPDSSVTRGEVAWVHRWLPFIAPACTEEAFRKHDTYLKKAQDADTRAHEAPILLTAVIFLVGVDAFLASRIISPHQLGDLTQEQLETASLGVGVVIGVVIGFFSHWGGALWRRARISRTQRQAHADATIGVLNPKQIALDEDQSVDDGAPAFEQCTGRARLGSHFPAVVCLGIPLAIVVLTVGLRWQSFAEERAQNHAHAAQLARERAEQGPVASVVEAATEGIKWTAEMIATALFGLIGAATVVVGAVCGHRHAVNGHQSKAALKTTKGYGTYAQMEEARYERIAAVQACFAHFQALLRTRRAHHPNLETVMALLLERRGSKTPPAPLNPRTGGVIRIVPPTQGA